MNIFNNLRMHMMIILQKHMRIVLVWIWNNQYNTDTLWTVGIKTLAKFPKLEKIIRHAELVEFFHFFSHFPCDSGLLVPLPFFCFFHLPVWCFCLEQATFEYVTLVEINNFSNKMIHKIQKQEKDNFCNI